MLLITPASARIYARDLTQPARWLAQLHYTGQRVAATGRKRLDGLTIERCETRFPAVSSLSHPQQSFECNTIVVWPSEHVEYDQVQRSVYFVIPKYSVHLRPFVHPQYAYSTFNAFRFTAGHSASMSEHKIVEILHYICCRFLSLYRDVPMGPSCACRIVLAS